VRSLNLLKEPPFNSMYHFVALLWSRISGKDSLTLSSINKLDEHHKWYVMMCVEGSSPRFLLNFRISEGILDDIVSHEGSWAIGSFFNHEKSGKSNVARKGNECK
jgi:hypothetical protein